MRPMPEAAGLSALDKHQIQGKCFDLSHFLSKSIFKRIHTWLKHKIIPNMFVKTYKLTGFEKPLSMKSINKIYPVKKMDRSMWRSRTCSRTKT